jgi:hypothetical protein
VCDLGQVLSGYPNGALGRMSLAVLQAAVVGFAAASTLSGSETEDPEMSEPRSLEEGDGKYSLRESSAGDSKATFVSGSKAASSAATGTLGTKPEDVPGGWKQEYNEDESNSV